MATPNAQRQRSYNGDYMEDAVIGESAVASWLEWNKYISDVEDVRDDPAWQSQDVDFLAQLRKPGPQPSVQLKVEAKTDRHLGRSGNILFETFRVYRNAEPSKAYRTGWSVFSAASWFCVFGPVSQLLYVMTADDLRAGFQAALFDRRQLPTRTIQTDQDTITHVVLVPEAYVPFHAFKRDGDVWRFVRQNVPAWRDKRRAV